MLVDALAYYAAHSCALFPIPAGQKDPFRPAHIVQSWKKEWSADPAQWKAWGHAHPNCNFGIVAYASGLIIVDVDTSGGDAGRAEAWGLWTELCRSWGLDAPLAPTVQSARGGWHIYLKVPEHIDAHSLRQPDAVKGRINIRCRGFTVAAGCYYDGTAKNEQSGPYLLMSDNAPHPAPQALVDLCTPAPLKSTTPGSASLGSRDRGDVAGLLTWLNEHGAFESYEDWFQIGMALKLEYGDDGLDLWQLTHDETVDGDTEQSKWRSFSPNATSNSVTLATFLQRAHSMGWRGAVRKSTSSMFDGVAAIAAAAGAKTHTAAANDALFSGQAEFARIATPYLTDFLEAADCVNLPTRAMSTSTPFPTLPNQLVGHPLYELMNEVLERISVMIEPGQKFKGARFTHPLGILQVMNQPELFGAVTRRMAHVTLQERKIKLFAEGISEEVQRVTVTLDKWELDPKTFEIQSDNPDNVEVALGIVGCEVRRNTWVKRTEIRGWEWPEWTSIDSAITNALRMRMMRTKTRFRPNKEFMRDAIDNIAMRDQHNPVLDLINGFVWDGRPRLDTWLSETCGVPADAYHAAVGKNVIGGIVKRARHPGCKHDEVMILMGPEGVTKSGFCRALALRDEWFSDSVSFEGSPQNIIPQMFGKLVIELAELDGMSRAESKHVKAFITRQNDNFTPKYEAVSEDNPRRSVFVGTSNETAPLVDITGLRRFLPVRINTAINIAWLKANVEQLYAEACVLESNNENFALPESIWSTAREHQESARAVSDIEVKLLDWFAETPHTTSAFVSVPDLVDACSASNWKNSSAMCHAIMPRLGFREARPYLDGKRTNVWVRGPEMKAAHIPTLTRYQVDTSQGRVRFIMRQIAIPAPPV